MLDSRSDHPKGGIHHLRWNRAERVHGVYHSVVPKPVLEKSKAIAEFLFEDIEEIPDSREAASLLRWEAMMMACFPLTQCCEECEEFAEAARYFGKPYSKPEPEPTEWHTESPGYAVVVHMVDPNRLARPGVAKPVYSEPRSLNVANVRSGRRRYF